MLKETKSWERSNIFFQMAHFSLFSEQPIGSYFYLTPRKRASSASKYFFSESARSLSTAAFSAFCPTTRIFLVDTCETADKSKDMCKCVYLKRVFIQIYFRILFTSSEELWLFLIHTHASHPKLFKKKKKNLKHGTRIFLAVTFFFVAIRILMWFSTLLIFHHHDAAATSRHQSVTLFTELL